MDSRTPIAAALAACLLAGCANSLVSIRTTNSPSMPASPLAGTSTSGAAFQADLSPGTYFSALFLGYLLGAFRDDGRNRTLGPSWRKPPEPAEERTIIERDCSLPMERPYANLRCK
jgi:hypothetical protein